jgi:formylglycine-generating enzyme required for sulfatase activity
VGTGKRAVWTVLDDHPDGLHTDLRLRVQTAHELTRPTSLQPGQVFRDRLADGSEGPEMVVIPAGTFRMEDIQGGGDSDEKPVHRVTLAQPFAMGRYEVIDAEFVRFLKAVGRRGPSDAPWFETHPEDGDSRITGSSGRFSVQSDYEDHPVVEVSWYGATAYANWLSEQTGKHYRLPTEAEWEHAARAGTQTKYWWGNVIGRGRANCYGCGGQWDGKALAPVGSFAANPFRLHDMVGNVWEWTCSAYTSDYDGSEATCSGKNHADARVLRGGGWTYVPRGVRSANRYKWSPGARGANLGFRLAQGS